jgi:predicted ATP-grasp superfamily ATP-dependent carboligase
MQNISKKLLLVGIDLSSLAISTKNAGYKIYSADFFGDVDLRKLSDKNLSMINQASGILTEKFETCYDPIKFINMVKELSKDHKFAGLLLSSGLDDSTEVLEKLNNICAIIGNSPKIIKQIRDKEHFFNKLKKMKICHPKTIITNNICKAKMEASEIGYPIILKPLEGFAGSDIRKANNKKELVNEYERLSSLGNERIIIQEFIEGTPASISFLASNHKSKIISINEQLLGLKNIHQPEPFGYCGNITPLLIEDITLNNCKKVVKKITKCFNLKGSNGIDVVISKNNIPYVIEVNPRFQGSLGCVEQALDVNLVEMHLKSCIQKELPSKTPKPLRYSVRLILYAPKRLKAPYLVLDPNLQDIPYLGSIIDEGEPFCSIFTIGENREGALSKAYEKANHYFSMIQ